MHMMQCCGSLAMANSKLDFTRWCAHLRLLRSVWIRSQEGPYLAVFILLVSVSLLQKKKKKKP